MALLNSPANLASFCRRAVAPVAVAALGFWAQSASAMVYSIDDGSAEDAVGANGSDLIYLNSFSAVPTDKTIGSISVAFGSPLAPSSNAGLNGKPFTVLLYSDPNNDGNPSDAVLLRSATGTISAIDTNTFLTVAFAPTLIPTNDFFAAFEIQNQPTNAFAAGIDQTYPTYSGTSWVTYGVTGTINATNLSANQNPPKTIESYGEQGNWLIRANTVPEPSTWAFVAAGVAALGFAVRRRARA